MTAARTDAAAWPLPSPTDMSMPWAELADAGPPLDVQLIWRAGRGDPAVARVVAIAAALLWPWWPASSAPAACP